ncbi:MAG: site-specific integrase [Candidatus Poribacteria bacterium]|nr:site-specific integrase [Candidatus Poribacteria bacterium]
MNALTVSDGDLQQEAMSSELSSNTRIAYEKGWNKFLDYCAREEIIDPFSVPEDEIARFLVHLATHPGPQSGVTPSMGTVTLYKSAVNKKYIEAGKPSPTNHPIVRSTLKGLARLKGSPVRRVEALREYHVAAMLQSCPDTLIGKRDAAVIAVGFAGALRRSEICGLAVDDVEFIDSGESTEERMWITIRQSKTDQHGKGQRVAIVDGSVIRPITRLRLWLEDAGIAEGPLFQTMKRGGYLRGKPMHHSDIPRIVKHYAALIGLDPKDIAGHSLRAGFVTSAAVHHARLDKIMAVTRHTNPATVMRYIRDADAFANHAGQHFL